MNSEILKIEDLKRYFSTPSGTVKAVDGVSFSVTSGETFGIVGESGSGKSTVAYTIMGIYPPTSGEVLFKGIQLEKSIKKRPRSLRKELQIVFQDPGSSLNPKRSVEQILELPLKVHGTLKGGNIRTEVEKLLRMVELPAEYKDRFPRELGGGEKQAIAIARAIATYPSLIILDEPTSALDVSAQAKVIRMLIQFQKKFHLSYVFITHNLSLMRNVASRVAIMYLGKVCEVASAAEFFTNPLHPYTKMLLSAIPVITSKEEQIKPRKVISIGEVPSPVNVPSGCSFHPRCHRRMEICARVDPVIAEVEKDHTVRCHLYNP